MWLACSIVRQSRLVACETAAPLKPIEVNSIEIPVNRRGGMRTTQFDLNPKKNINNQEVLNAPMNSKICRTGCRVNNRLRRRRNLTWVSNVCEAALRSLFCALNILNELPQGRFEFPFIAELALACGAP